MMTIIKVLAALIVLTVLGGTFWLVDELRSEAAVPQLKIPDQNGTPTTTVEPEALAFERARELLATADFEKARENLEFIVGVYPASESADEARRILGELNLDELLSIDVMDDKELYKVQRGDAYLGIASKFDTTLDCLMHLNGLQRLDQLYPGNELVLLRLNLNVKVDVPRRRLTLMKDGRFLKAYPLKEIRVKPGSKGVLHTTISGKTGFVNGKAVRLTSDDYRRSSKVITLADQGLRIRSASEKEEGEPENGFFVENPDQEELVMLLRVGNEVEVRFTNP